MHAYKGLTMLVKYVTVLSPENVTREKDKTTQPIFCIYVYLSDANIMSLLGTTQ